MNLATTLLVLTSESFLMKSLLDESMHVREIRVRASHRTLVLFQSINAITAEDVLALLAFFRIEDDFHTD